MKPLPRAMIAALAAAALLAAGLFVLAVIRQSPQHWPWTPLDLRQPIGWSTGAKLAALARDFPQCRMLLDKAGVRHGAADAFGAGRCQVTNGVRMADRRGSPPLFPADVATACPVAAALVVWRREIVEPAARRHYGQGVSAILHLGSHSCRRMYGRPDAPWSEHARANAIDIAGFRLANGRRVMVLDDWFRSDADAAFLREVRDGACRLFTTVLSPDYNAAHRDHLHFDQADRGRWGMRSCR